VPLGPATAPDLAWVRQKWRAKTGAMGASAYARTTKTNRDPSRKCLKTGQASGALPRRVQGRVNHGQNARKRERPAAHAPARGRPCPLVNEKSARRSGPSVRVNEKSARRSGPSERMTEKSARRSGPSERMTEKSAGRSGPSVRVTEKSARRSGPSERVNEKSAGRSAASSRTQSRREVGEALASGAARAGTGKLRSRDVACDVALD
jgi:hypothetical protein